MTIFVPIDRWVYQQQQEARRRRRQRADVLYRAGTILIRVLLLLAFITATS